MTEHGDVPEVSFTSRVAFMASMASIAMSYQPGLFPLGVGDQAILTGLTSAVNYGLVAVTGSALEGAATSVVGRADAEARRAAAAPTASRTRHWWQEAWLWGGCCRRVKVNLSRATCAVRAGSERDRGSPGVIASGILGAGETHGGPHRTQSIGGSSWHARGGHNCRDRVDGPHPARRQA